MSENSSDTKALRIVRVSIGDTNFKSDGTVEVVEEHQVRVNTRPADEEE